MFKCERCGSGYSASHLGVEHCPRCMLLDRVQAPLTFKIFAPSEATSAVVSPLTADKRDSVQGSAQRVRAARWSSRPRIPRA